jgi:hypothetical protein
VIAKWVDLSSLSLSNKGSDRFLELRMIALIIGCSSVRDFLSRDERPVLNAEQSRALLLKKMGRISVFVPLATFLATWESRN